MITRLALVLTLTILLATACSTTHQVKNVETSGYLKDYSQLKPGLAGEARLLYIAPDVDWAKYTHVMIDPTELWTADGSALSKLSRQDKEQIVSYLFTALSAQLGLDYMFGGPTSTNCLWIRTCITEGKGSKPVLDTVSTVMPAALVVSTGKRVVTGTDTAVGEVTVECEILDTQTKQRLAAAVDRRAGTKALRAKGGKWKQVYLAFDFWAERLRSRLKDARGE